MNRFGLSYNERILIGVVIIASIVFFLAPAILVGVLIHSYGSVIAIPFPIIVSSIGLYVLWRIRADRRAKKRFEAMTEAAQPVTGGGRDFLYAPATAHMGPGVAEILPATSLNSLATHDQIPTANSGQSENAGEKERSAEVHQDDNESERTMEEQ